MNGANCKGFAIVTVELLLGVECLAVISYEADQDAT